MSTNKSFSTETSERYARALYEIGRESSGLEKIEADVKKFQSLLQHPLLRLKMEMPSPPPPKNGSYTARNPSCNPESTVIERVHQTFTTPRELYLKARRSGQDLLGVLSNDRRFGMLSADQLDGAVGGNLRNP